MLSSEELVVHCDGGARGNPGPGGAGCVIEEAAGKKRLLCGKYLGRVTNNQAEYAAVELAFNKIRDNFTKVRKIRFFLDSALVVNQLNGLFKAKNPGLLNQLLKIRGLERPFEEIYYQHISRDQNTQADSLVNRAIDSRKSFQENQL